MKLKKIIALFIASLMIFSTVLVNAETKEEMAKRLRGEQMAKIYEIILNTTLKNYKYDITREELLEQSVKYVITKHPELLSEFSKGAYETLDPNSAFYTYEEFSDVYSDVSGIYVGIGILVHQDGSKIILGEALENSPAQSSGLQVGDILVKVGDIDITGFALDKVTSMIKGVEGTSVTLTVLRNDAYHTYTINRAQIKVNPVTYNIIEDTDVGYVKISAFNANTTEAFEEAVSYFESNGIKKVVLDLRNNLGGYINAAVSVASHFVPDGKVIVTAEYKDESNNQEYAAQKTKTKLSAVVLINEYSASASEIVASALRDYGSGVLVGKRSYGKGTVQTTLQIGTLGALWLTVAEYYTPSHVTIHNEGLSPDYIIANTTEKFDMSTVTSYDILRVLSVGDKGEDVYAVKERLKKFGYNIIVDDVYDQKTADAVLSFQQQTGLYPYGKADITTQVKINDVLRDSDVVADNQLKKAIELAKELK